MDFPLSVTAVEGTYWTDLVCVPTPRALGTIRQEGKKAFLKGRMEEWLPGVGGICATQIKTQHRGCYKQEY